MSERATMKSPSDIAARAKTYFNRNWRAFARDRFLVQDGAPSLAVNLGAPRERDIQASAGVADARAWVSQWRTCDLPGDIEWQTRQWARLGTQEIPVRIRIEGAEAIARWAGKSELWATAEDRIEHLRARLGGWIGHAAVGEPLEHVAPVVQSNIRNWCAMSAADWLTALDVLEWLLAHPGETRFARQLPIRGIETKWVETHGAALRPLYRALAGHDFCFAQVDKLFRCKSCDAALNVAGCSEFALSAVQLAKLRLRPRAVLICENLVNVESLGVFEGVLAIHGGGFAVTELAAVPWLAETPIVYWGDLDTNGFAILNALRAFAPRVRSVMMDCTTLERHRDLCVEESTPFSGELAHLTAEEREALDAIRAGDAMRGIDTLRLEQERIEWAWACERLELAFQHA